MKKVWEGYSEQGSLVVESKERAVQVIVATAISRMHTRETIKVDKDLKEVADVFDLSLEDFKVRESTDPNDYPFIWSYTDKETI